MKNNFKKFFIIWIIIFWVWFLFQKYALPFIDDKIKDIKSGLKVETTTQEINFDDSDIHRKLNIMMEKLLEVEKKVDDLTLMVENSQVFQLKPFKDELFKYRAILETKLNGNYKVLEYSQKKDIEERDEVAVDKAHKKFIDRKTKDYKTLKELQGENFNYYEVTDIKVPAQDKKVIVMYLHWYGGNKEQWIADETFGWNFNRLMNLMIENKWVFISTDAEYTREQLVKHIVLLEKLKNDYPNAKIIIAGASQGWVFLWDLIASTRINNYIDWVIFLWTVLDDPNKYGSKNYNFLIEKKIPMIISHWSADFLDYKEKEPFTQIFTEQWWKIQTEIFKGWVHWTPIRMIDWKENINWILRETKRP